MVCRAGDVNGDAERIVAMPHYPQVPHAQHPWRPTSGYTSRKPPSYTVELSYAQSTVQAEPVRQYLHPLRLRR